MSESALCQHGISPLARVVVIADCGVKPQEMGGAMALGHTLGATGIRLAGTLSRLLHFRQQRYGCAAAWSGGGQGIALIPRHPFYSYDS